MANLSVKGWEQKLKSQSYKYKADRKRREVFSSFNEVDFTFKGAFENPVRGKVDAASGRLKGDVGGKH